MNPIDIEKIDEVRPKLEQLINIKITKI